MLTVALLHFIKTVEKITNAAAEREATHARLTSDVFAAGDGKDNALCAWWYGKYLFSYVILHFSIHLPEYLSK